MSENKVFMDADEFKGIVSDIRNAANDLLLSEEPFGNVAALKTLASGSEIIETLMQVYRNSDIYRSEASRSLPKGLLTLCESMKNVDEAAVESINVERNIGGNKR